LLSISDLTIFDNNLVRGACFDVTVVICFQFLILRSLITTYALKGAVILGCDLLSISDLTIFDNNKPALVKLAHAVVICFQFLILRSLITTQATIKHLKTSCDLLSISDLTIFDNNQHKATVLVTRVVICFQFLILRSLITTPT